MGSSTTDVVAEAGDISAPAHVDGQGRLDGGWIEYRIGFFRKVNAFGEYRAGQKDGEWVFRDRRGEFLHSESFELGVACGQLWLNRWKFIELDKQGKVVAMGSGCRDCPPF